MCVDMCVGMRADMCTDMCADMCVDMCADVCAEVRAEVCAGISLFMHLRILTYKCVHACLCTCPYACPALEFRVGLKELDEECVVVERRRRVVPCRAALDGAVVACVLLLDWPASRGPGLMLNGRVVPCQGLCLDGTCVQTRVHACVQLTHLLTGLSWVDVCAVLCTAMCADMHMTACDYGWTDNCI